MKKIITVFLLTSLVSSTVFAAEPLKNWSVGFGGGPTIGGGFMGRYEWESGWGMQAAVLPYYANNNSFIAEAVTGTYTLDRNEKASLYLSLGVVGWHSLKTENIWPVTEEKLDANGNAVLQVTNPTEIRVWRNGIAGGPGVGFKFNFFKSYVFSIDLPAAVVLEVKNNRLIFDSFRPWPNLSLMYNF